MSQAREIPPKRIADLGRRVELVPMDAHGQSITVGLYERAGAEGRPEYLVHTYSDRPGAHERIEFVRGAMKALGGMEDAPGGSGRLRFACGQPHRLACKRVFLEACKLPTQPRVEPRPLCTQDRKSGRTIEVVGLGQGEYRVASDGAEEGKAGRLAETAGGLSKLAELHALGDPAERIAFPCGQAHDALVGLLLPRALNVRAALRELELAAARGILVAPSAQKS